MDDRAEIAGVIGALAVHVDARQWGQLLDLFAPEVRVDYTSLSGGEQQRIPREQLIENWGQMLPGFTRTTHLIGTPMIAVGGDRAQASASVVASHFISEPRLEGRDRWIVGGCYEMSFVRQDGGWRIETLALVRAWAEGNLDLPELAARRAGEMHKGPASR